MHILIALWARQIWFRIIQTTESTHFFRVDYSHSVLEGLTWTLPWRHCPACDTRKTLPLQPGTADWSCCMPGQPPPSYYTSSSPEKDSEMEIWMLTMVKKTNSLGDKSLLSQTEDDSNLIAERSLTFPTRLSNSPTSLSQWSREALWSELNHIK